MQPSKRTSARGRLAAHQNTPRLLSDLKLFNGLSALASGPFCFFFWPAVAKSKVCVEWRTGRVLPSTRKSEDAFSLVSTPRIPAMRTTHTKSNLIWSRLKADGRVICTTGCWHLAAWEVQLHQHQCTLTTALAIPSSLNRSGNSRGFSCTPHQSSGAHHIWLGWSFAKNLGGSCICLWQMH